MQKLLIFSIFLSVFLFAKETDTNKAKATEKVDTQTKEAKGSATKSGGWGKDVKMSAFSQKLHSVMSGYYFSMGVGPLLGDVESNKWFDIHGENSNKFLNNNSGFYLSFGHNFNKWFSMEMSYSGGFQYKDTSVVYDFTSTNTMEETTTDTKQNYGSIYLDTVFRRMFTKKDGAFLKLGLGYNVLSNKQTKEIRKNTYDPSTDSITTVNPQFIRDDILFEGMGVHLAVGYQHKFTKNKGLGFSYNFYSTMGSDTYEQNGANVNAESPLRMHYSTLMLEYTYTF